MKVFVEIPGEPFALQRGRARVVGGKYARVYDPKANTTWKGTAGQWMLAARNLAGALAFTGPVSLRITALFACPKTDERVKTPRPERWSKAKKDVDNIAKAVGDAGNGILWLDDRQVVSLIVTKRIAAQGEPARVLVEVEELEGEG